VYKRQVPVLADVNGECEATASAPTTTDNCAGTITGTTLDDLTYNTQGTHVITWSFDDGNGNVSTATQNVVIHDGTAPTLHNCLVNVTSSTGPDNQNCDIAGSFFTPPYAIDNCLGTLTTTIHMVDTDHGIDEQYTGILPAGTRFYVGTTHMTYTFADPNGNSNTCSFDVIVTDNTVPSITCPANISVCDGEPVTIVEPVTGDNCGVATVVGERSDALALDAAYPVGPTTITWTVTDIHGNTNSCQQTVTVKPLPVVTAGSYGPVCIDANDVALVGNPTGGVWTGTGVSGDQTDGYNFDPSVGTQTLTYTYTAVSYTHLTLPTN
jgi:hypothetical protein